MQILVDADACPVKEIIVRVAREMALPVIMFVDTAHIINDGYSRVVTVDKGADSVDIALVNALRKGNIVVTQDYGVAAMALGKRAAVLDQNGRVYTAENIDRLLFERHIGKKIRRAGGRANNVKKRSPEDDLHFEVSLRGLLAGENWTVQPGGESHE